MEKIKIKKSISFALIGIVIATIFTLALLTKNGKIERLAFAEGTNTSASLGSLEELKEDLIAYPELYQAIYEENGVESRENIFITPGMDATLTLHHEHEEKDICTTMTPQGLAVNKDYLFISAYCQTKAHNSVIYVLEKKSGSFIKEIVLDGISHAGCRPIWNRLPWTGSNSTSSSNQAPIPIATMAIRASIACCGWKSIRCSRNDMPSTKNQNSRKKGRLERVAPSFCCLHSTVGRSTGRWKPCELR